ncbi:hypothetical protein BDV33DRAFT_208743 [Aspergillus novoparasiticus]|uniref:Uncharacterized protein n=1 Tax=Aspergillus novoparasiticus TaxID=986946 RepID=A0A5N6EDY2_9EURO|nr:hypothetical protein BDV33DRAFT_208743 [Aspergillus novoparasiticus]
MVDNNSHSVERPLFDVENRGASEMISTRLNDRSGDSAIYNVIPSDAVTNEEAIIQDQGPSISHPTTKDHGLDSALSYPTPESRSSNTPILMNEMQHTTSDQNEAEVPQINETSSMSEDSAENFTTPVVQTSEGEAFPEIGNSDISLPLTLWPPMILSRII